MVESDVHRFAPLGWIGVVALEDRVVIATPAEFAALVERGPAMSPDGVAGVFGVPAQILGPALLAYGNGPTRAVTKAVGPVPAGDRRVRHVLEGCSPGDQDESDLMRTDSGVFPSIDSSGDPVSASGYRRWPKSITHMSVLTIPAGRGAGHGTIAAAAAIEFATRNGLLAQWRAEDGNAGSQALARSLGLTQVGRQLSFRPQRG